MRWRETGSLFSLRAQEFKTHVFAYSVMLKIDVMMSNMEPCGFIVTQHSLNTQSYGLYSVMLIRSFVRCFVCSLLSIEPTLVCQSGDVATHTLTGVSIHTVPIYIWTNIASTDNGYTDTTIWLKIEDQVRRARGNVCSNLLKIMIFTWAGVRIPGVWRVIHPPKISTHPSIKLCSHPLQISTRPPNKTMEQVFESKKII